MPCGWPLLFAFSLEHTSAPTVHHRPFPYPRAYLASAPFDRVYGNLTKALQTLAAASFQDIIHLVIHIVILRRIIFTMLNAHVKGSSRRKVEQYSPRREAAVICIPDARRHLPI